MKDFFRNSFDLILKHIISQLGMTIFGITIVLTAVFVAGKESPWILAATGLAVTLYLFLIYVHTWEFAAKEKIKIDGGRMKYNSFKGLYIALISNAVNIILALFMCLGYYVYILTEKTAYWAGQMFGITNIIARALNGMYNGALVYLFPSADATPPYMFLIIVIPALITSFLAYYFGVHNKRLFPPKNTSKK